MGQKSRGPLKMSLETAQKVIVPQKNNYVPHFLKQRDINSYLLTKDGNYEIHVKVTTARKFLSVC